MYSQLFSFLSSLLFLIVAPAATAGNQEGYYGEFPKGNSEAE